MDERDLLRRIRVLANRRCIPPASCLCSGRIEILDSSWLCLESPGALACCRWAVPVIRWFRRRCKRSTSLVCGVKQNHLFHFLSWPCRTSNDPGRISLGRGKCDRNGVEGALVILKKQKQKQNKNKIKGTLKLAQIKLLRYKILHSPERFCRIDRRTQRMQYCCDVVLWRKWSRGRTGLISDVIVTCI